MKKMFLILMSVMIAAVFLFGNFTSPVKYAVKSPKSKSYIACIREKVTGYDWVIVDEKNNDTYLEYINIANDKNFKKICESGTLKSDNVFYIYG